MFCLPKTAWPPTCRKANWAHLVVRSGSATGCAGGEARDAPKPNERVYRQETETVAEDARGSRIVAMSFCEPRSW